MNEMFGFLFPFLWLDEGAAGGSGSDGNDDHADDNADKGGDGGDNADQGDTGDKDPAEVEFDAWLEKQPKETRDSYAKMDEDAQKFFRDNTSSLRSALQKERDTGKTAKKSLKAYQDAETKRKRESMTELEKTQAERDEALKQVTGLQSELKGTRIMNAVVTEASKLNFRSPEDAYSLLDSEKITVEEDGTVKGVTVALKELAKGKPYLIKTADGRDAGTLTGRKGARPGETTSPVPKITL